MSNLILGAYVPARVCMCECVHVRVCVRACERATKKKKKNLSEQSKFFHNEPTIQHRVRQLFKLILVKCARMETRRRITPFLIAGLLPACTKCLEYVRMILPLHFALPRTVALSWEVLWSKVDNAKNRVCPRCNRGREDHRNGSSIHAGIYPPPPPPSHTLFCILLSKDFKPGPRHKVKLFILTQLNVIIHVNFHCHCMRRYRLYPRLQLWGSNFHPLPHLVAFRSDTD